ncbi:MAG: ABC transporter permease [Actinomycetota bacterium]
MGAEVNSERAAPTAGVRDLPGVRVLLGAGRFVSRVIASLIGAVLLVMIAVEISFDGGFRATLLPSGPAPGSAVDQRLVENFRLNDSVPERLFNWIRDGLNGDLGLSVRGDTPVTELMAPRLPISLELMLVGALAAVLIGIPLGLLAAAWSNRRAGTLLDGFLGISQTVPVFITPLFLIWLFALELEWLPAAGWVRPSVSLTGNLESLILPAITLAFAEIGPIARVVRADAISTLGEDYIAAARSKGLGTREIMFRHVLRPSSLGTLNVLGINLGALLSGSIIVELIFGIPGLGQLLFRALLARDLYVLLGLTAYFVIVHATLNGLVDLVMRWADPRTRREGR